MLKPSQDVGSFSISLPLKRTGAPPAGDEGKREFLLLCFCFWLDTLQLANCLAAEYFHCFVTPLSKMKWSHLVTLTKYFEVSDDAEGVLGGTVICPSISSL